MTPLIADYEGNEAPIERLRQMAHVPAWDACAFAGLDEGICQLGETLRVVFARGTYFHRDTLVELLGSGDRFRAELVAEPDNEADPFAVAIHLDGERIGYVPREAAIDVQPLVMRGQLRVAAMSRVNRLENGFSVALLLAWGNPEPAEWAA